MCSGRAAAGGSLFLPEASALCLLFWGRKHISDKLGTGIAESGFSAPCSNWQGRLPFWSAECCPTGSFGARRMPVAIISLFALAVMIYFLDDLPATRFRAWRHSLSDRLADLRAGFVDQRHRRHRFGTKKGASTASGLINGAGSIGAIVGGTIPGFFQKQWGWQGVFTFLAVAVLLAALLLLPKWNALPASQRSPTQQ